SRPRSVAPRRSASCARGDPLLPRRFRGRDGAPRGGDGTVRPPGPCGARVPLRPGSRRLVPVLRCGRPLASRPTRRGGADGALELADSVAHPFTSAFALDMAAAVNQFRGEAHLTLDRAARAVSVSV